VIDEPGHYALSGDIQDSQVTACIRIASDDVYLDGRGHEIAGLERNESVGILLKAPKEGEIRNVTAARTVVTDWETGVGQPRIGSDDDIDGVQIVNNHILGNTGSGITFVDSPSNSTITGNTVEDNERHGILLFEFGYNHEVAANSVRWNGAMASDFSKGEEKPIFETTTSRKTRATVST
jgi:parallel beta-helix repeat protein